MPGKKCHVFFDGVHMDYLNQSDPGTAYDLHTNTTTLPPWMTVCTVSPYLIKNGTTYSVSTYPALAQHLGLNLWRRWCLDLWRTGRIEPRPHCH